MAEYAQKFNFFGKFIPEVMDSKHLKMIRFKEGFLGRIYVRLSSVASRDYADAY